MTNKIFAGIAFLLSYCIYISTMAPTTSFWDCGEFIACSYTLGVPHPPGTPLYLLIGNVFSNIFFFIDDIGARVNLISPIVSAFSVMFLYLIIVELISKWFKYKDDKIFSLTIYLSAFIGSLLFAFTDSQWFNAVEAEVYGMSTLFTAIVVWLALKWSNNRQENGNVKYIILISYLMGLAIGVHLLNLLAIPFIALILYFNITKDQIGRFLLDNIIFYILGLISFIGFDILGFGMVGKILLTGIIISLASALQYLIVYLIYKENFIEYITTYFKRISVLIVSGLIFLIINSGIIKGIPNMLNFFNSEDSSFIMNFFFPLILVISLLVGVSLFIFIKNKLLKVSIISLLMIYIGFSTYILIPIRAIDNPNINENSPDSWKSFLSYMNRDQYGNFKNVDWKNILKYSLSPKAIGYSEFQKLNDGELFWLNKDRKVTWKKLNQIEAQGTSTFENLAIGEKFLIKKHSKIHNDRRYLFFDYKKTSRTTALNIESNISEKIDSNQKVYQSREFNLTEKVFRNFQFTTKQFSRLKDNEVFWNNYNTVYLDASNQWKKAILKGDQFPNCINCEDISDEMECVTNNCHWDKKRYDCESKSVGLHSSRDPKPFQNDRQVYQKIKIDDSRLLESPNIKRWAKIRKIPVPGFEQYQFYTSNQDILNFIWDYQIKEMYLRYFGWQFIGKEYDSEKFSWSRNEKNSDSEPLSNINWYHYGLPFSLIFGIIGMIYHFTRDPRRAFSVLILFIVTGLAIILYLNQYDPQPRERDYSYVGSFFAFSIWIGIGCMALFELCIYLFNLVKEKTTDNSIALIPIIPISLALLIIMPINHLIRDYHYHDRKGNYAAWDYGYNLLNSCEPYSVLFTNGDNDTFPLWYVQEVDNVRPDVRVVNLSLLNTPWYINQIYNNNALGNIKFNFNEPILSQSDYNQIQKSNTWGLELPIFEHESGYYIDLNNNNQHDIYNEEQTVEIIKNLEDPVTGTIYAYKRWDPLTWAFIEQNYFKLEIMQSFENLDNYNILKLIYGKNYNTIIKEIDSIVKNDIHSDFDEIIDLYIKNQDKKYESLLYDYNFKLTNSHFEKIKEIANKDNKRISEYLTDYIGKGYGIYSSSTCDNIQPALWGKTPDRIGENYLFPISEYANGKLNPTISYQNKDIKINQESTLQDYFFRIQDIMILKIIEDIEDNRNIYFATTVNPESQMSLDGYLLNQGMVLKLHNKKLSQNNDGLYRVDTENLRENLFEKYRFTNLNNPDVFYNSDLQRILQNYRMLFLYLADEYREPDDIKEVLTYMNKVMPPEVIKIKRTGLKIYTLDKYRSAGMMEDYNKIIEDITDEGNILKNIELADYLTKIGDLSNSNDIIKESLSSYNQELGKCLLSIDIEIRDSIENKETDILIEDVENIIYSVVTDNLIKSNINYYDDELILQSLQILLSNYINTYLPIIKNNLYE